jgi:hypothetical protein
MTVHKYVPDHEVKYPFKDYGGLEVEPPARLSVPVGR